MSIAKDMRHLKYYEPEAFKKVHTGNDMKAYDYMKKMNEGHMRDVALTYFGKKITYEYLDKKIEEFAIALKQYGIQSGDYVSICLPNVPEMVYFKYACNRIGAVACLMDPRTNAESILEKVNNSASKLLISVMDICNPKIDEICEKAQVDNIVYITASDSIDLKIDYSVEGLGVNLVYVLKNLMFRVHELINHSRKYMDIKAFVKNVKKFTGKIDSEFIPNFPFTTLYTSGTTGISKGAQLSNEAYNAMTKQMSYGAERLDRGDTFLGCIPFFSAYGSFCGMHNSLSHGWNIILIPQFNPNEFDKLIKKYKPNNVLGVPRFWESLIRNGKLDNEDLSFFKIPVTGGDKITPTSLNKINKYLWC